MLLHEKDKAEEELTYLRALEVILGDIAYTTGDMRTFGRTLRTVIDDIQFIRTGQEQLSASLDVRKTVITVLIPHDKAHDGKQVRRMDTLTRRVPSRQYMPYIRPDSMKITTFCHLWCKITKLFAHMQKKM